MKPLGDDRENSAAAESAYRGDVSAVTHPLTLMASTDDPAVLRRAARGLERAWVEMAR